MPQGRARRGGSEGSSSASNASPNMAPSPSVFCTHRCSATARRRSSPCVHPSRSRRRCCRAGGRGIEETTLMPAAGLPSRATSLHARRLGGRTSSAVKTATRRLPLPPRVETSSWHAIFATPERRRLDFSSFGALRSPYRVIQGGGPQDPHVHDPQAGRPATRSTSVQNCSSSSLSGATPFSRASTRTGRS